MAAANCRRLVIGQFFSQACEKMMTVGLIWVLAQSSDRAVPLFLCVSALPHLLLSAHAGGWTSRIGILRTVIVTDLARGSLFLGLALLWPHLGARVAIPALIAFSFASNCAGALFNPAILSLPLELVDASLLQQTTAMVDSCFSLGAIVGPLLSAVLYPRLGLQGLFAFNGLSFIAAAAIEAGIRARTAGPETHATESAQPRKTARALLREDALVCFMLLGFLSVNLFLGPLLVFLPLFVKECFAGGLVMLSTLEFMLALGMALGGVLLSFLAPRAALGVKITTGMVAVSLSYLGFVLSPGAVVGAASLLGVGFALSAVNIFAVSFFQTRPRLQDVPVVMSLVNLISVASLPLSMAMVAVLTSRLDIRSLAISFGVILFLITSAVVANPRLRNYRDRTPGP